MKATLWVNAPDDMKNVYTSPSNKGEEQDEAENDVDYEQTPLRATGVVGEGSSANEQPKFTQGNTTSEMYLNYDSEHNNGISSGHACIWDTQIDYATQVELNMTLLRLMEHFSAAALSMPQSRSFDAVCCIVPAVIASLSDVIMRQTGTMPPFFIFLVHVIVEGP